MNYQQFLEAKKHSIGNYGVSPETIPDQMFDFQKYVTDYAIKKGRCAVFLDTGLGKTLIELTIAQNYVKQTNKPVLIITPLAVAFQFIKEAEKFGIDDIEYSKVGIYTKKIVVCNYERLNYFNHSDFDCVILDESSILKNFDGAIKRQVTSFLKRVKYRYLFTATPSPNDFVELGTSSEALGYLGYTDMLTRFFTNNEDTIKPQNIGTEWILKGHAKDNFFKWVSGWSISMRKPSDLGFDDTRFILPELITNFHSVKNENNMVLNNQILLFNLVAKRLTEIKEENRLTIEGRCQKAAELSMQHDISMVWCNLNAEGDLLEKLIPGSVQVSGDDSIEAKEEAIRWFIGDICICKSTNFRSKLANKCGNKSTRKTGEKSIMKTQTNGIEESNKEGVKKKTENICPNTIDQIPINSNEHQNKKIFETLPEETNTLKMKNSEIDVLKNQNNGQSIIPKNDQTESLNNTELQEMNIMSSLKNKMEDVPSVDQKILGAQRNLNFTSTIATQPESSEDYFAQTVISDSENLETISNYSKMPLCTCGHLSGKRRLISKVKIFGFGLNLQHCNHTVYFPTFSYEQYYQAIRRFWRFGQKRKVTVDLVYSDGQKRVLDGLIAKADKANELFSKLNTNVHQSFEVKNKEFNQQIKQPLW